MSTPMNATIHSPAQTGASPTSRVATLYVGDLAPDVSEPTLYDFFSKHGPVVSVRVCRDMHTQVSLGYSYVNFQNSDDAARVIELLNYTPLKPEGKPMRIMWYQRDPSLRKSGLGNVFVKDLNREIDDKQLCDVFNVFGNILSAKVSRDKDGKSNGYGFVHFEKQEDAKEAIEKMNGMMINGVKVYVGEFKRRKERSAEMDTTFSNVFFRNILPTVTEDDLISYLSRFGKVESLCLRESDNFSTKFGFANFESHESALQCINDCNDSVVPHISGEEPLYASRAMKKRERQVARQIEMLSRARERQVANLYVKNLPESIDDVQLREMFKEFGSIISCKVQREPTTKVQKGFGYVAFVSKESADRAVAELNGKSLQGKPLYVAFHQSAEQRRRQLEQRRHAQMGPYRWPGFGPAPQSNNPQQAPVPPSMPSMYPYPNPWQPAASAPPPYYNSNMRPTNAIQNTLNKQSASYGRGPAGYMANPNSGQRVNSQVPPNLIRPGPPNMNRGPYGPYNVSAPMPTHNMPNMGNIYRQQNPAMAPHRSQLHQNMHNMSQRPLSHPQQQLAQQTKSIPGMQGLPTLTSTQLAAMTSEEQKNALGERLYARIYSIKPEQAAKITGMLLEMDTTEILNVLEDDTVMHNKIEEAITVLRAHQEK